MNIDPGYLTQAKLVLASTKDHAHRIYLDRGIFAEVTLFYKDRHWQHRDWTFPDYRRADYHAFFDECRQFFHTRRSAPPPEVRPHATPRSPFRRRLATGLALTLATREI